jgi:hypothetical protein
MDEVPENRNHLAVITRQMDLGDLEVVAVHFADLSEFTKWVGSLPKEVKKVDTGGKVVKMGDIESYDPESKANTIAVFYGTRTMVYSWNISDMAWSYMKTKAAERPQEKKQGRPPKLVQPLQTWRKWSKKDGAVL